MEVEKEEEFSWETVHQTKRKAPYEGVLMNRNKEEKSEEEEHEENSHKEK